MNKLSDFIDVSKWQGEIDWEKVKASKYTGAIIRAGYSWYLGGLTLDERFKENIESAIKAKMPVGVYLYAYDKTTEAVKIAAQKLYDLIAPYKLELGVYYDIEDKTHTFFTRSHNTELAKTFCNFFKQKNYYTGVYSYLNFANHYLDIEKLKDFDFWIAHYSNECGYKGDYGMWQYTSKGIVNGITGNVDLNYTYKDYATIILNGNYNNLQPEKTEPSGVYMHEVTGKQLFITANNCEYFNSLNINDIEGKLVPGLKYNLLSVTTEKHSGFDWGVIEKDEQEYFVVILEDRCIVINSNENPTTESVQKALWPGKFLRITQDELSTYSHTGSLAMDSGDENGNIQKLYAPCDMTFTRIRENESSQETYAESVAPVLWADGTVDYMSFTFMHDNIINSNVYEGATVQQGEYFYDEGGFGRGRPGTFANHCHIEVSRGKSASMQSKNAYGTFVTANQVHIYDALFIPADCKVLDGRGHVWKNANETLEKEVISTPATEETATSTVFNKYNVRPLVNVNFRTGPSIAYSKTGGLAVPKYLYTILELSKDNEWGRTSIGWLKLEYTQRN